MDYNEDIIAACEAGVGELESIKVYTMKMRTARDASMRQVYANNRADELPHIQNIVLALTAMLSGEEPAAAAQMDGVGRADDFIKDPETGLLNCAW